MTDDHTAPSADQESGRPDSPLEGEGSGEGVDLTSGEPNTFEPEEDPEAAPQPHGA